MSGEIPGFFHYDLWDRGHDCVAAGPFLGLPFLLSYYSFLRRLPPGIHPVTPIGAAASAGCTASFVAVWRLRVSSCSPSRCTRLCPAAALPAGILSTLRERLLAPGPAGGFLLATTGILISSSSESPSFASAKKRWRRGERDKRRRLAP